MNAIKGNPYRILGLFGNATERDLQRQLSTLKAFARIGKTKSFDYDFPFLGDFNREEHTVQQAASRIEQAKNKVHYSLFWFLKANHIDEAALNHLKETNIEKATEIWGKLIKDNSITSKNYSAAINLSTLQLGLTTLNGSFSPTQFQRSIELKGLIILSDAYMTFVQSVAGETTTISKETILKEFVEEVLQIIKPYLNKSNGITSAQLITTFKSFPTDTKQYLSGKFIDRPISNIEAHLENTKERRKSEPEKANKLGFALYASTQTDLTFLKEVLGVDNVQYQMLTNKLANELLQCAIDYFNESQENDSSENYLESAQKLTKLADSIAVGKLAKDRAKDSLATLEEMKDRELNQAIAILSSVKLAYEKAISEIDAQVAKMTMTMSYNQTINYSKVDKMKANCLNWDKVVEVVNNGISMNDVEAIQRCSNQIKVSEYKNLVDFLFGKLGPIQINQVKHICFWKDVRAAQAKSTAKKVGSTISSASDGCYIATMAYGDYDHPQVLELRKFRDETLAHSKIGRNFIAIYYNVSPKFVELLKSKSTINSAIRTLLNAFICIIK